MVRQGHRESWWARTPRMGSLNPDRCAGCLRVGKPGRTTTVLCKHGLMTHHCKPCAREYHRLWMRRRRAKVHVWIGPQPAKPARALRKPLPKESAEEWLSRRNSTE